METLGFHKISNAEKQSLERFFAQAVQLLLEGRIITRATALRQQKKMSLDDALIAATALEHKLTLVTRNVKDFEWIEGLTVLNPVNDALNP